MVNSQGQRTSMQRLLLSQRTNKTSRRTAERPNAIRQRQRKREAKEPLQCAVCCQAYEASLREPVVLPSCGHTFCRLCLYHLQDEQRSFLCPFCRSQHSGLSVDLLPVNYIVMSFLEATGEVEEDDCNEETQAEGTTCFFHLEPLLLWCQQCREVLCAKCLTQHQHDGHTLQEMSTVLADKKTCIEKQTNEMLGHLEEEKQELTRDVEEVVAAVTKIYERSEILRARNERVNAIQMVNAGTDDLMAVADLELILNQASKSTTFPDLALQRIMPLHRTKNNSLGDEDMASNEAETTTCDGDKDDLQMWPLTRDVKGGRGEQWPIIPWNHLIAQVPAIQLLVPPSAPEVYLHLKAAGVDLGCVHIRFWGQLRRAQHFLALCLGTFGPSYRGAKFRTVGRKGEPGESLRGGDYLTEDGKGTSCRGVMTGLEWGGEHAGPVRRGVVGGGGGGCHESDALFNICLQDKPQGKMSCPFGKVVSGMSVVWRAANHHPLSEVTIVGAGLVRCNA